MKKLTVAIPNYNGGENLKRAINSCKKIFMEKNEFEILIVDNCSTDNSIDIINTLKDEFSNIRLIQNKENVGRVENWNVSIDNAEGKFLIFLFSNDLVDEDNNIDECVKILEDDNTISIGFSSLRKKDFEDSYKKKSFSEKIIKCKSKSFTNECLIRGLLPFGPIQSIIYRSDDIKKDGNKFRLDMPINADEIFTYTEARKRDYILFNPSPQITWDLTKGRFHKQMKIEDEFEEHTKTIKMISDSNNIEIDYGLVSTYRVINLLKFSTGNLKSSGKKDATMHLLSKMKESGSFFNTDKILFKTFFRKLTNSDKDADDILYSEIIKKCFKKS